MTFELNIRIFRPDRPGVRKVLGDLEADVMEVIWAHSGEQGITVRVVFEEIYARRRIAYTTIMNTMTRLANKHILRVEKREQGYIYAPNFTEQEFIVSFIERMLEELFVNFLGGTMAGITPLSNVHATQKAQRLLGEIERRQHPEKEK